MRVARPPSAPARVGWLTYDTFLKGEKNLDDLDSFTGMRVGNMARWMSDNSDQFRHEVYDPRRDYDVVVFQKMMNRRCQREVVRLQAAGTAVVFDANVNYYEIWGDYPVPGTKPTVEQQRDAVWMTRNCDWVVADSSYLAAVARKVSRRVTWIPDNVDTSVYAGLKPHPSGNRGPLKLVWSGVSKKAAHLDLIRDVVKPLPCLEIVLVCDDPDSSEIRAIAGALHARVLPFGDRSYAATLLECDVIISPKFLTSAYEMAHTEYKITLGMAVGLPAIASPQPSYIEAISYLGGGIVARTPYEWREALEGPAADPSRRSSMGALAQKTVAERYATPVVGQQYLDVLSEVVARVRREGAAPAC
jgi:glycosyltransferase involved in cell wall biosynthesis